MQAPPSNGNVYDLFDSSEPNVEAIGLLYAFTNWTEFASNVLPDAITDLRFLGGVF
jgi:hypothetical protein